MDPSITSPRLFVRAALYEAALVPVTAGQAHHLGTVLRRGPGDTVRLFNGTDGEWVGRIATLRRERCALEAMAQIRPQQAEPDLWLAFAPLKRDATDLVAEKATELGVSALMPVITERTVAARVNLERMEAIAISSAEQCERFSVPRVTPPVPLAALLTNWPAGRMLVAAVERRAAPPPAPLAGQPGGLLVGPEGGFTEAELALLGRHPLGLAAGLGPRILRAETATIVGLALLVASAGG
jgi:16S rRNA (uracil1498-N3)-methyltransferase